MELVNVGTYYCKYCKKERLARLYTDNPNHAVEYKEACINFVKNQHWYDYHYNCAVCGKWIPSGERELVIDKDFKLPIHPDYIDEGHGLLRVHKNCIGGGEERDN